MSAHEVLYSGFIVSNFKVGQSHKEFKIILIVKSYTAYNLVKWG